MAAGGAGGGGGGAGRDGGRAGGGSGRCLCASCPSQADSIKGSGGAASPPVTARHGQHQLHRRGQEEDSGPAAGGRRGRGPRRNPVPGGRCRAAGPGAGKGRRGRAGGCFAGFGPAAGIPHRGLGSAVLAPGAGLAEPGRNAGWAWAGCRQAPRRKGSSGSDAACGLPPPAASSMHPAKDAPCGEAASGFRGWRGSRRPALPWLCLRSGRFWERIPFLGGQRRAQMKNPTARLLFGFQQGLRSRLQQLLSLQLSSVSLRGNKPTPSRFHTPKFPLWQWDGISKRQPFPGLFCSIVVGSVWVFFPFLFPMTAPLTSSQYQEWQSWARYPSCCHSGCVQRKWPLPLGTDQVARLPDSSYCQASI